jgi:nitrate/nitrite transport system ATP-binding protein
MSSISIRGVSKIFPTPKGQHVALQGVDLEVPRGEFVSFIGHSGCGKSTLLNMVAGLTRVSAGELSIDGAPVKGPGLDRAMVFQNYSLLPWLTVRENVFEAVDAARPKESKAEKEASVDHFLNAVKLGPHADKRPGQLSGGMKQRVAIARAFAVHPKILILDEPFGALDALTKGKLHDTLLELWKDPESKVETVLMVTHDIDEAIYLSDRIVVLSNGPAARIAQVLEVGIARPRNKRELSGTRQYAALKTQLLEKLSSGHALSARPRTTSRKLRLGFVPLIDAAPLVVAHQLGFWKKQGLEVELWKQPSWAAVRDKVLAGELHARTASSRSGFRSSAASRSRAGRRCQS